MVEKVHHVSVSECQKEERTRETREEGAEGSGLFIRGLRSETCGVALNFA